MGTTLPCYLGYKALMGYNNINWSCIPSLKSVHIHNNNNNNINCKFNHVDPGVDPHGAKEPPLGWLRNTDDRLMEPPPSLTK